MHFFLVLYQVDFMLGRRRCKSFSLTHALHQVARAVFSGWAAILDGQRLSLARCQKYECWLTCPSILVRSERANPEGDCTLGCHGGSIDGQLLLTGAPPRACLIKPKAPFLAAGIDSFVIPKLHEPQYLTEDLACEKKKKTKHQ